tara:strand:+ start:475 stop:1362 length:888 start_codon:yes stop_codon:yes gene_type:complete
MVNSIVLTTANITDTTKNSTFEYEFPNSVNFKDMEIALINASLYYSWFNISDELSNRTFSYQYTVGVTTTTRTVTLDEGLYEISDINKALQFDFIAAGLYLVDSNGDNVYYAEFLVNSVKNSIDINTYAVPTSLPSGFTEPSNFVGYPTATYNVNIQMAANFNNIVGYASDFETGLSSGVGTTLSFNSTKSPNVNPNSSVLVEIDIIDNPFGTPSNIIYAIVPNVGVGSLIYVSPAEYSYNTIKNGIYNKLRLRLLNKDTLLPLTINDGEITIILGIKEKYSYEQPVRDAALGLR